MPRAEAESSSRARIWALRALAIGMLTVTFWPRPDTAAVNVNSSGSVAETGASSTAAGEVVPADETVGDDGEIVFDQLWSPAPGAARIEGRTSLAPSTPVSVRIDDAPIGTVAVRPDDQGRFTTDLSDLAAGPTTVCLNDVCDRVLIRSAETSVESRSIIDERIDQAIANSQAVFDISAHLPGWTIQSTEANSSVGGYALADGRAIFISANPGRTLAELTVTVLHELGHAVDVTYMDDARREAFRTLRSHDASLAWGQAADNVEGDGRWHDSAEDFAEVFVAWVLSGGYVTQSTVVAPQPNSAELVEFCELLAIPGISCVAGA